MAMTSKIENLMAALERLSKRERYMVAGVAVMFVIFVSFLVGMWISSSLDSTQRRVETKTASLRRLIDRRHDFQQAKRRIQQAKRTIRQGRNIQLMGTVEDYATQLGVVIEDMQPRSPAVNAETGVAEEKVEVNIKTITIDRLVDFLRQLERRADTIAVRKLHLKQSFQEPDKLEVNLTVSNFKIVDEDRGEPEQPAGPGSGGKTAAGRPKG
jgi:type II secretory pathway component PulM